MSTIENVTHIGASGFIGQAVLQALIDSGFNVKVLTREDSKATFPSNVKVERIDYSNRDSLIEALKGQDAVVSTIGVRAIQEQYKFIDAAIAAGVQRFIPSEFGCDVTNEKTARLPAYKDRVDVVRHLQDITARPSATFSYTSISTSVLVEAIMGGPRPFVDAKTKQATVYDGGDVAWSITPASLAGEAVVAVLQNPEITNNKSILIHGGAFTENYVLDLVQRYVGKDGWQIDAADTAEMEQESWKNFEEDPGNLLGWLPGFVRRGLFGEGYGGDFTGRTSNEILGLRTISGEELDHLIKNIVL